MSDFLAVPQGRRLMIWRHIGLRVLWSAILTLTVLGTAGSPAPAFAFNSKSVGSYLAGENALSCLALTIYFEARGEPLDGKLAVGHVVMNRTGDENFPDRVCEVVKQGGEEKLYSCQFSWWCDGLSDKPVEAEAWEESIDLAKRILVSQEPDPTRGALWYHADMVNPSWSQKLKRGPTIGRHIFYWDVWNPPVLGRKQLAQSRSTGY